MRWLSPIFCNFRPLVQTFKLQEELDIAIETAQAQHHLCISAHIFKGILKSGFVYSGQGCG